MSVLAVLLALAATAAPAFSAEPQLGRISPPGGQRGTEAEVILTGPRLADAQELLLGEPGIRVVSLEVLPDKSVKARLAIAPDCLVGPHGVRVRTAGGISNLLTFSVGVLPDLNEAEPNNDFAQPQPIALNHTVNGVVENEDVDYFAVDLKKGQRIVAEVEGLRLGETFFDPYLAIMDTNRFVVSWADDTPLVRQDAVCAAVAPQDGRYVIELRESSFGGSGACRYRLHVGTFPRPLAAYPAGGKPGQTLEVRWLGDVAGPWTQSFPLPATGQSTFELLAQDPQGFAPSPNPVRVVDLENVPEAEPNNAPAQATACQVPAALNGILEQPGDVDCFKFPAKQGQVFDVRVYARTLRTPVDSVLSILRSSGAGVASNDDTDTPDSYLRFTAPADDDYVVQLTDQLARGGPDFVYRVEVTPVRPRLTLSLPERSQFVDVTPCVPRGNRMAVMVGAQRDDLGGEVALELRGLPAGVTAEVGAIAEDQTSVPVLLSAAADAPLAGALADLVGRCGAGDQAVEGHLSQRTALIRGQNNREVWNYYADRMALAVAEAVPFRIDIAQPKVPLVQNGSMDLKVVAARESGFTAPITLTMLYNPPGVSAPSSVTIPEGQNEAVMPLTADGGATLRRWKIAVLGQAPGGEASVVVASQLADLEVAAPFFRFTFAPVAVDQGQAAEVSVKIDKDRDFEGPAKVELLGLPNEVSTSPKEFTKDSTEIVFPLETTANSPVGLHKTLICRAVVTAEGEPIVHMLGGGELRIQKPLPPKPAAEAAPPPPPPPTPEPQKPPEKRLSRLEQLRLEKTKTPQAAPEQK